MTWRTLNYRVRMMANMKNFKKIIVKRFSLKLHIGCAIKEREHEIHTYLKVNKRKENQFGIMKIKQALSKKVRSFERWFTSKSYECACWHYNFNIIHWNRSEIRTMNTKWRKLLTFPEVNGDRRTSQFE